MIKKKNVQSATPFLFNFIVKRIGINRLMGFYSKERDILVKRINGNELAVVSANGSLIETKTSTKMRSERED